MAQAKPRKIGEVYLSNVRGSFLHLIEPKSFDGNGPSKYQGSFLIDITTKPGKRMKAACEVAIEEMLEAHFAGKKVPNWQNMDNDCFYDGNEKDWDGYEDTWVVAGKNTSRVNLFDEYGEKVMTDNGKFYSGAYFDAIVRFYVAAKYPKRLCCSLEGVKFRADGDAFGSGGASSDDFDRYERGGDDEEEAPRKPKRRPVDDDDDLN